MVKPRRKLILLALLNEDGNIIRYTVEDEADEGVRI
jgi:hypothetical protein